MAISENCKSVEKATFYGYVDYSNGGEDDVATGEQLFSKTFEKTETCLSGGDERVLNVEIAGQKKVVLTNSEMFAVSNSVSDLTVGRGVALPELEEGDRYKCLRTSSRTDFIFLLTEMGKVYYYGKNSNGIFGITGGTDVDYDGFHFHSFLSNLQSPIVDFECGYLFAVARSKNGDCYGCGYNCYTNIGVDGDRTVDLIGYTLVSKLANKVKKHACGSFHTLYLTFDNELYGCGLMTDGQLGGIRSDQYNNNDCVNLVKITFGAITHFKSICSSGYSSFVLSTTNELIHFGKNTNVLSHDISRKSEHHVIVPLEHANELIGQFGSRPDENIDIAIMRTGSLYIGLIMCKEGTKKGLIEMIQALHRYSCQDGAMALSDISLKNLM